MHRRTFLTAGSVAAIGFGVSACSTNSKPSGAPKRTPVSLVPVKASWDRVIRTTVGLRPHRDAGFVLKTDKLDDKLLVHNYGHGGAGMSLAWGTGLMAAEFATEHQARQAAVIGCGSVGLTCARQLQRRGFDVTIYAIAVPPNVTSNMSLAGFTPESGLVLPEKRTPEWDAQYRRAADISYRQLQLLAGPHFGVSWLDNYSLVEELRPPHPGTPERPSLMAGLAVGQDVLGPGEHPFATKYALRSPQIRIEPNIYLDNLVRDFQLWGGHIVIRKFDTPRELAALREPIVDQLHGSRREGSVRRPGAAAAQGTADGDDAAIRGELSHQRRRAAGAGSVAWHPHDGAQRRHHPRRNIAARRVDARARRSRAQARRRFSHRGVRRDERRQNLTRLAPLLRDRMVCD